MFCSQCGKGIEKNSTFCGACGVKVAGGATPSGVSTPPSPKNKKNIKPLVIGAIAIIGIVILLTQMLSSPSIIGTWERESGRGVWGAWSLGDTVEFFPDGSGVADDISFTWTTERGRLRIFLPFGDATTAYYEISGSTLTITPDNSSSQTIYRRVR